MTEKICKFCKKDRSAERLHVCNPKKPHDCKVDGHIRKPNCITIFACEKCDYTAEIAPELQPSMNELALSQGIDPNHHYEGDDY